MTQVERYVIAVDGKQTAATGLRRPFAVDRALRLVAEARCVPDVRAISIHEEETGEFRARWVRTQRGWTSDSAAGWLS